VEGMGLGASVGRQKAGREQQEDYEDDGDKRCERRGDTGAAATTTFALLAALPTIHTRISLQS
jgi:hypothetical protein